MAKRIDTRCGRKLIDADVLNRGAGVENAIIVRILDLAEDSDFDPSCNV
ncbi:MAG: hypothetical protein M3N38_00560 [Pseudomonadota bacterium]|nr:hypothetical protein [Pseudomonadota bacterium]